MKKQSSYQVGYVLCIEIIQLLGSLLTNGMQEFFGVDLELGASPGCVGQGLHCHQDVDCPAVLQPIRSYCHSAISQGYQTKQLSDIPFTGSLAALAEQVGLQAS